jgi:hypothetical protein
MSVVMETLKIYYHNGTNGRKFSQKGFDHIIFSPAQESFSSSSSADAIFVKNNNSEKAAAFCSLYDISLLLLVQFYCAGALLSGTRARSHSKIYSTKGHMLTACALCQWLWESMSKDKHFQGRAGFVRVVGSAHVHNM